MQVIIVELNGISSITISPEHMIEILTHYPDKKKLVEAVLDDGSEIAPEGSIILTPVNMADAELALALEKFYKTRSVADCDAVCSFVIR
jgi:hypothetical protein